MKKKLLVVVLAMLAVCSFSVACDGVWKTDSPCAHLQLTKVEATENSCSQAGNTEYYVCTCGKWFTDETAQTEITDKSSVVLAKKTHAFTLQNTAEKYLKTAATCTTKAVYYFSCECGEKSAETFEYGEIDENAHSYGAWKSNGDGTHTKTCANDSTHTVTEDCNGGTATCTKQATCKDCGAKYGTVKEHEYNMQNATAKYLKSEATCTAKAVYYYSCACGEKSTQTFEYGESKGHAYGDWTSNDDGTHTKTCANDSTHIVTEDCNFNQQTINAKYLKTAATCTDKAVYYYSCECGEKGTETFEFGTPKGHSYGAWVSNGDGTHTKTCKNDSTHTMTEDCNGGTATCIEKATCKDCGTKYGALKEHEYNMQNVVTKYLKSAATCTAKAVYYYSCACGEKGTQTFEYGKFTDHTYTSTWSFNDTYHWHAATCGCDVTQNNETHTLNDDGICTVCDNPISATSGVSYTLSSDGTYYVVDDYTGTATNVRIAESYNGLPVKEIAESAFYDNTTITKVIIPSSVTVINGSAFKSCTNLTSITIPNSVTSIGNYAFYQCSKLTSVTIGNGVTSIGEDAFYKCTSLTSVNCTGTIDQWVQIDFSDDDSNPLYYAKKLYINNELVTNANITTATKISNYALYNCTSLTSITISDRVTSIGNYAFYSCSKLTSVTIGNSVILIGSHAFENCYALTSITIGDSVTSIGNRAFEYCSALTSITIPDSVTSIGDSAFSSCYALTSVTIGNSVTSIGSDAFSGCSSLIVKNKGVHYVDNWVVDADSTITSAKIKDGTRGIANSVFKGCSALTSITIPDSVTSIGSSAFYNCTALTSVTIGNSVILIGSHAFENCYALTSVNYTGTIDQWTQIDFSDYNSNPLCYAKKLYINNELVTNAIITTATKISAYAFRYYTALTSITIPDSVTSIGFSAFYNCTALTSVYYKGTIDEWNKINIDFYNSKLTSATRYYYSETQPTSSGNYWHYDTNGEIIVWEKQ